MEHTLSRHDGLATKVGARLGTVALLLMLAGCDALSSTRTSVLPPVSPVSSVSPPVLTIAKPPPIVPVADPSPSPVTVCSNSGMLATWSVTRLAQQTIVVPANERNVASVAPEVAAGAGGVILFGSVAPPDLAAQLQQVVSVAPHGIAPLVMTDEEGGSVQRMANLVGFVPSARQMGATMTSEQIRTYATGLAQRLRAAGVTMDLAPVLDVDGRPGPSERDPDGTRSFSANPGTASADGLAFAEGLEAGGIVPVVKHFPGLGGATGNTDVRPASTLPWSVLSATGMVPFDAAVAAHVPAVMIANATVPGLTTLPASISAGLITETLRNRLGYQGLVLTDSLSATALRAIGYSIPQAVVAAIRAGADMVLFSAAAATVASITGQAVSALASAVTAGTLDRSRLEAAVTHILAAKGVALCPRA